MSSPRAPELDPREAEEIVQELLARLPGYVPGWSPSPGRAGYALAGIFARYLQTLGERINQAPDKNKLAFLDLLGIDLLPAQAARAPVVFEMQPDTRSSRAPARTRLGADLPGLDEPLIFETETTIGLTSSRLVEVMALWPGRDAYADHSAAVLGGQPFTLFDGLQSTPHEFYLAHDLHFALSGTTIIELQFDLAQTGNAGSLPVVWEYWDGEAWQLFKPFTAPEDAYDDDSVDGTDGFRRSGIIRLVADCGSSEKKTINGIESYWIRCRLTEPLPPDPTRTLPLVDLVNIQTVTTSFPGGRVVLGPVADASPPDGSVQLNIGYISGISEHYGRARLTGPDFFDERLIDSSLITWGGLSAGMYTLRIMERGFPVLVHQFWLSSGAGLQFAVDKHFDGQPPEAALANGIELDLTKTYFPFGQQAQAGAVFYFHNEDVFSRPGAQVTVQVEKAITPQEEADAIGSGGGAPGDFVDSGSGSGGSSSLTAPQVAYEYWDGGTWRELTLTATGPARHFGASGSFSFIVPDNIEALEINGEEARWLRARIRAGSYARLREVDWPENPGDPMQIIESRPPALDAFTFGYVYQSPADQSRAALAYNDFQWIDHSQGVRWRGAGFEPFSVMADRTPTLYLGFDGPLPSDTISLFLDIEEAPDHLRGPTLRWEYWNGSAWAALTVNDETNHLALPGMVQLLWPGVPAVPRAAMIQAEGDTVQLVELRQAAQFRVGDLLYVAEDDAGELATLAAVRRGTLTLTTPLEGEYGQGSVSRATMPRFGTPRTWVRARLQTDGDPHRATVNGLHLNAVWASQTQTITGEVLGSSTGQTNQALFFRRTPVLPDYVVEVRELEGARAEVELPILREELLRGGLTEDDIRPAIDPGTGRVREVWVRWQPRPNLLFSGPEDRHYVVERTQGRLIFGDNTNGRVPTAGANNIRAAHYRTGGGQPGNVPAGAIEQLLAAVPGVQSVSNPRAGEGGASGEPLDSVRRRGPRTVRHRRQAITLADYEALAREVAVARALPTTHPSGRTQAGWVRVIIMPQSRDPRPQPSLELRRRVRAFITARAPAAVADRVTVSGPDYLPVGAQATIAPVDFDNAGQVFEAAAAVLTGFLNPLNGGPDGDGWPFGRDVYLSDVAAALEAVPGVDYVQTLNLLLDGTPQGERVPVPPDRIVVAGDIRVTLVGSER
jgi:uncharacterized phage protein gp47/JayE